MYTYRISCISPLPNTAEIAPHGILLFTYIYMYVCMHYSYICILIYHIYIYIYRVIPKPNRFGCVLPYTSQVVPHVTDSIMERIERVEVYISIVKHTYMCAYVYMYVCMYVCIYIYIYKHIYVYIYTYIYVHIYLYTLYIYIPCQLYLNVAFGLNLSQ